MDDVIVVFRIDLSRLVCCSIECTVVVTYLACVLVVWLRAYRLASLLMMAELKSIG